MKGIRELLIIMQKLSKNNKTWTKNKDWSSEEEVYDFLYGFVRAIKPHESLELGTFEGDATDAISRASEGNVTTIDIKDWGAKDRFKDNDKVKVILGNSPQDIPNKQYDFVFVDSGHTYDQVIAELIAVDKLLVNRGYILVHDILHEKWGSQVLEAVAGFIGPRDYAFIIVNSYNGVAVLQKNV